VPDELPVPAALRLDGLVLDEATLVNSPLLPYVRTLVNLIEGLQLHRQELVDWLRQALRQLCIASRKRADYVLYVLHQHPP
jgi:hypothetical protein